MTKTPVGLVSGDGCSKGRSLLFEPRDIYGKICEYVDVGGLNALRLTCRMGAGTTRRMMELSQVVQYNIMMEGIDHLCKGKTGVFMRHVEQVIKFQEAGPGRPAGFVKQNDAPEIDLELEDVKGGDRVANAVAQLIGILNEDASIVKKGRAARVFLLMLFVNVKADVSGILEGGREVLRDDLRMLRKIAGDRRSSMEAKEFAWGLLAERLKPGEFRRIFEEMGLKKEQRKRTLEAMREVYMKMSPNKEIGEEFVNLLKIATKQNQPNVDDILEVLESCRILIRKKIETVKVFRIMKYIMQYAHNHQIQRESIDILIDMSKQGMEGVKAMTEAFIDRKLKDDNKLYMIEQLGNMLLEESCRNGKEIQGFLIKIMQESTIVERMRKEAAVKLSIVCTDPKYEDMETLMLISELLKVKDLLEEPVRKRLEQECLRIEREALDPTLRDSGKRAAGCLAED